MKKNRLFRAFSLVTLVAFVLSAAVGCSSNTTAAAGGSASTGSAGAAKGEILVGVSTGLTGSFTQDGEKVKDGILLAQDEINNKGGVLGKNIKFIFEDDQNNATTVVNVVNKLASENIVALLGPTLSSTVMAAEQTIKKNQIPCLTGATSPKLITLNNPYLFRVRASDSTTAKVAAKYAVDNLKAKKIGILYNNDEMGTGAKGVMEAYFKSINASYVSEGHNTGDKDMTGQLVKMKNAGVDTLLIWTHDQEFAVTARQIKELGLNVKVIGNPGLAMPQELNLMEKDWVEGFYCITDIVPTDTNENVQTFVKNFTAKYNTSPELYSSAYYGAAIILSEAITKAGSTDSDKICKALMEIKGLKGPEGEYNANDKGELLHECVIAQIKDKTPVMVDHVKE